MRRRKRIVVLVLAVALVAAACSSSSGGDATADGSGVKIGVLVPLTGEEGAFGQIVADTAQLAVDEINATGLNPCGQISLTIADTQTNPEQGIREGNRLMSDDSIVAVVGPTSETMVALVDSAISNEVVLFSPYAGTISLNDLGGDFVYRTVASDLDDGKAAGLWLSDQQYQRVAILTQNEESTISIGRAAADSAKAQGVTIVGDASYAPGQTSYLAELSSVLDENPDAIFLAGGQQSGVTILKEAAGLGYEGEWLLAADMAVPEVIEGVGSELMEGVAFAELASADTDLPTYKAFEALHQSELGEPPGPFAANSYDMMNLIALAMTSAKECSGAAINDTLRDVSSGGTVVTSFAEGAAGLEAGEDIDYDGASGPVDIDDTGSVTGSYAIVGVLSGEWTGVEFYPAEIFAK
ncbi:MAG: ABC transporter substrate-binding protein [Acidimicrobiia bacterium]